MSDELTPNELYRMIVRNESSITSIIALREKDLTTIKDDRHALASRVTNQITNCELKIFDHSEKLGRVTELSISTAAAHTQLIVHAERLARFEEQLKNISGVGDKIVRLEEQVKVVSGMGGKGLSILMTALVGLAMGIVGAWLTGRIIH